MLYLLYEYNEWIRQWEKKVWEASGYSRIKIDNKVNILIFILLHILAEESFIIVLYVSNDYNSKKDWNVLNCKIK